jgi:hypothetical protein
MTEQTVQWEYRVLTVGSVFGGAKDEQVEATLNEWGLEGWEAVNVYTSINSSRATLVAKRPMTAAALAFKAVNC